MQNTPHKLLPTLAAQGPEFVQNPGAAVPRLACSIHRARTKGWTYSGGGYPGSTKRQIGPGFISLKFLECHFGKMLPQKSQIIIADAPRSTHLQPPITEKNGNDFIKVCLDFVAFCWEEGGPPGPRPGGAVERPRELTIRGGILGSFLDEILNYYLSRGVVVDSTWGFWDEYFGFLGGSIFEMLHSGFLKK